MRGYIPPQNDEEQLFVKRIKELSSISFNKEIARATPFLTDRQQALAQTVITGFKGEYLFEGGHEQTERKLLCFGETAQEAKARIKCLLVAPRSNEHTLTHRDFLGAFLSLFVKREAIGDILFTNNGDAVVFVLSQMADVVLNELTTVGNQNVSVTEIDINDVCLAVSSVTIQKATLASLRLDAILAAMLHISRSDAQKLITQGLVMVNHISTSQTHYEIQENDVFTIKNHGKYKLCSIGGKSRKDRVFIEYQKY